MSTPSSSALSSSSASLLALSSSTLSLSATASSAASTLSSSTLLTLSSPTLSPALSSSSASLLALPSSTLSLSATASSAASTLSSSTLLTLSSPTLSSALSSSSASLLALPSSTLSLSSALSSSTAAASSALSLSSSSSAALSSEILDKEITDFISEPTARTSSESSPKRTKTNKKKELTPFLDRIGITFPPPLVDIAGRTTITLPSWPPLKTFCDQHKNLSSPIPIASDAKSLENISIMIILHFPGDVNLEKMIEYGLLWKTENNYIGEPCLRFLNSVINKMLYALSGDGTRRTINGSIAWWDICPVPGPNNCGGDHNLPKLQDLTTAVLIQFMKKLPNLKKILFFGKNPNIYSIGKFLSQLEKRAPKLLPAFQPTFRLGSPDFNSPCQFNPHPQFYLMGLNTKKHTMDLIRVGADVINTEFGIDITQQLMQLNDDDIQEIIPFATEAVIEARRLVLSQVMKAHWANPEGPFRNVSQLMKDQWANPNSVFRKMIEDRNSNWWRAMRLGWADPDSNYWKGQEQASQKMIALWANPDGPFRNVSQKLIDHWAAMYSLRQPCPRCGISIHGNYGTGMASHLRACQGKNIDDLEYYFEGNLPNKNDIIVLRGRQLPIFDLDLWKGNYDFKVLISEASSSYHTSISRYEKSKITDGIMNKIKKSNGRFVLYNFDKKIWEQQLWKYSRQKISKRLKEHSNL